MKRRFPVFRQLDSQDCGLACIRMIAQYYGKYCNSDFLAEFSQIDKVGLTFLSLKETSEKIGMKANAYSLTFNELKELKLPVILHWNANHFVVLYKMNSTLLIADPAFGLIKYSKENFLKSWIANDSEEAGYAIQLTPGENFIKTLKQKNESYQWSDLVKYIKPHTKRLVWFICLILTGMLINLSFPYLTKAIVDRGIGKKDINFLYLVLIGQVALTIGGLSLDFVKSWIMLKVTYLLSFNLNFDFLHKLTRLPIASFESKNIGDILQRIRDNTRIQNFITGTFINLIVAFATFIVYSVVIFEFSVEILLIFFGGSILYILWILLFQRRRAKLDHLRFQELSTDQNNSIQFVMGIQEMKLNNCEAGKLNKWKSIQERLYKLDIKSKVLEQVQTIGSSFIDQSKNFFITLLTASLVIEDTLTLGTMMAMQYIIGQLNVPIRQTVGFIQSFQDADISMERISEIYRKKDEDLIENSTKLYGTSSQDITFKDVSFKYNSDLDYAIKNVNITLKAGKVNAIVGTSGSGKSTIFKMLLGYYPPSHGRIYIGDEDLSTYNKTKWRNSCGTVMQESFIFSDSIINNINLKDEETDMDLFDLVTKATNIKNYINSLPRKEKTIIGLEGNGLSSGQRQRILLARAIYKQPEYILLDEATNALDAINENEIISSIKQLLNDKTIIIIAHRLSTVKDADNIIVMENGEVVESGTHNELILKNGKYYQLIKNQISNLSGIEVS